jgi:hypothetical protein
VLAERGAFAKSKLAKPQLNRQRIPIATLPAIAFEVVPPQ